MNNKIIHAPVLQISIMTFHVIGRKWLKMFLGILLAYTLSCAVVQSETFVYYLMQKMGISVEYIKHYVRIGIIFFQLGFLATMKCGISMFILNFLRTFQIDFILIFEGFRIFGKIFLLSILYILFTFCPPFTILVVPVIIGALKYSMCFYLRVDNPRWTTFQCLGGSAAFMEGSKIKLMKLYIFFMLFMIPPVMIIHFFEDALNPGGPLGFIWLLLCRAPAVFVYLYMETSVALFYEMLTEDSEQWQAV